MSAVPPGRQRSVVAKPDKQGVPTFEWSLTDSALTDVVQLVAGPFDVLPVVFVPGIMGSNLRVTRTKAPVWRLDKGKFGLPWNLVGSLATKGPGPRQQLLHPDRCEVDPDGAVPKEFAGTVYEQKTYVDRGWGTVGEGSYHSFLLWLEQTLNAGDRNPVFWSDYYQDQEAVSATPKPGEKPKMFPGLRMGMKGQPFGAEKPNFAPVMSDDLIARSKFLMPVYAVGYNWLESNDAAAGALLKRIGAIIRENNKGQFRCAQVILVTHSMGGLVARACAKLPGATDLIAGVVHGVMPAVGAAVAYRRCKVGMADEDFGAGLVIGSTGRDVTAVFAQAPGALQLLPSHDYSPQWLRVQDAAGKVVESWPAAAAGDPYAGIYLRRDRWWGLVNEAWLSPTDGAPITWKTFEDNVEEAKRFHTELGKSYHPQTFSYYGADPKQKSFEKVTWRMRAGIAPDKRARPAADAVVGMTPTQVRMDGSTPEYVGGKTEYASYPMAYGAGTSSYQSSYWELHCELQDGAGDGTVPTSSGAAPLKHGGAHVQQQFKLTGFGHEPAYHDGTAQRAVLYSLTKIVGVAKRPK
jgi:pimeloyl-ACP methyl ester carboxylesterase